MQELFISLHSGAIVNIRGQLEIASGNVRILRTKARLILISISPLETELLNLYSSLPDARRIKLHAIVTESEIYFQY